MVTNDERRRVAAKLRSTAKWLGRNMDAHEFAHYGADAIDPDKEIERWNDMMYRLADLIDPDIYPDNPDKTRQGLSEPCDRDALLTLADEMDAEGLNGWAGPVNVGEYAQRIREACGEVARDGDE